MAGIIYEQQYTDLPLSTKYASRCHLPTVNLAIQKTLLRKASEGKLFFSDAFRQEGIPLPVKPEWIPHMTLIRLHDPPNKILRVQVRAATYKFANTKLGTDRVTVDRLQLLENGAHMGPPPVALT